MNLVLKLGSWISNALAVRIVVKHLNSPFSNLLRQMVIYHVTKAGGLELNFVSTLPLSFNKLKLPCVGFQ